MPASPSDTAFDLILYVGAGPLFRAEDGHRRTETRHVVLDPDPVQVRRLEKRTEDNLTILHGAPAAEDGEAEVRVFNIDGLASLAEPTGLKEEFPGVRVLRTPLVPLLSPGSLLEKAGPFAGRHRLVIDAPGTGTAWLEGLHAAGGLHRFDEVDLRTSAEALFAGGQTLAAMSDLLTGSGFEIVETDTSDPDWPVRRFRIDRRALEIEALKQALSEAQAGQSEARARVAALETEAGKSAEAAKARKARIEALEAELKAGQDRLTEAERAGAEARDRSAGLEKSLKEVSDKADWRAGRIKELEAEAGKSAEAAKTRKARIEALEAELKAGRDRLTEAERAGTEARDRIAGLEKSQADAWDKAKARAARIAELEAAVAKTAEEMKAREERIAGLERELGADRDRLAEVESAEAEARARITDLEAALAEASDKAEARAGRIKEIEAAAAKTAEEAKARREALEKSLDQNRSQLEKTKADLSLALRLQTIGANDLRDLQQSYAALQTRKRQQDDLIGQLLGRLEEAARHLDTVPRDSLPSGEAPPRLAGRKKKGKSKDQPGK
ncbi:hypothetical protein JYP51_19980 [Ponticoccus gilvus]|nr:hypothetical protein [Enemella evansiae]